MGSFLWCIAANRDAACADVVGVLTLRQLHAVVEGGGADRLYTSWLSLSA